MFPHYRDRVNSLLAAPARPFSPVRHVFFVDAKQLGTFCASSAIYVPISKFENGALKVNLLISSHFSPGGRVASA
jgi:hypothetical protein